MTLSYSIHTKYIPSQDKYQNKCQRHVYTGQTSKYQGDSQGRKQVAEIDGSTHNHLRFKFNEYGHVACYCPSTIDTNNSNNENEHQGRTCVGCA